MSDLTGTIRDPLVVEDEEYRRLQHEHAQYAAQLEQLESKKYLSEQEQIEETRLKKLKLRAKDQMQARVQRTMSV